MSSTKKTSILRSFIIVPMVITSMSLTTFTEKVDSYVLENVTKEASVSLEDIKLQKERELKAAKIDAFYAERNMPLSGYGMKMVIEAEKYDLDWRLIPAIAVRESTGGRFACKRFPENAWGWHSCKAGLGGSTDSAIELIAQHLSGEHPRTSRYYASKTTNRAILQTYNPPSVVPTYADEVIAIMNRIEAISL